MPEPNPFDVVKVGQWVRRKGTTFSFNRRHEYLSENKWYQRINSEEDNRFTYFDNDNIRCVDTSPFEWDLTDIRDYNPDEEIVLKIGDILDIHGDG